MGCGLLSMSHLQFTVDIYLESLTFQCWVWAIVLGPLIMSRSSLCPYEVSLFFWGFSHLMLIDPKLIRIGLLSVGAFDWGMLTWVLTIDRYCWWWAVVLGSVPLFLGRIFLGPYEVIPCFRLPTVNVCWPKTYSVWAVLTFDCWPYCWHRSAMNDRWPGLLTLGRWASFVGCISLYSCSLSISFFLIQNYINNAINNAIWN